MELGKEIAKKIATDFYYWWHNQPGTNTQDGFDSFWEQYSLADLNEPSSESSCYPSVTMQQLIDVGLNAFAVKLLSESVIQNKVTKAVRFKYESVGITIEPIEQDE